MEKLKVIVVAVDLETQSDAPLARAAQLAAAHAAWLVVVHVIEGTAQSASGLPSGGSTDLNDRIKRHARDTIDSLVFEHGRTRRTDVVVEFGVPHDSIRHLAESRSADLIVIGPGNPRSLGERMLGSTADRVIRTVPAPVLVVKKQPAKAYGRVAVAVDFSPQSAAALKEVRRLAPQAKLRLIHAVDIPATFQQAMLRTGTSQAEIATFLSARRDSARQELSAFMDGLIDAGEASTLFLDGEPGRALVRFSTEQEFDLFAMGPHGRGLVRQALLGSVTQRVLSEAGCDVLIAGTEA
ncbi:MAG: universal stress protein [Rhizobiales bacterium]|nr:universal stress protein [Hyphomicrobiales bacterium]